MGGRAMKAVRRAVREGGRTRWYRPLSTVNVREDECRTEKSSSTSRAMVLTTAMIRSRPAGVMRSSAVHLPQQSSPSPFESPT